jgi:hypothetical protein
MQVNRQKADKEPKPFTVDQMQQFRCDSGRV